MQPKDAEGIANSVDPDQTAPLGTIWSGSALFVQPCLSENLGKSRYLVVSYCGELNAHFYSAASLKYHAPDTQHDTTLSHIILTLGWPILALPSKSESQVSNQYHF